MNTQLPADVESLPQPVQDVCSKLKLTYLSTMHRLHWFRMPDNVGGSTITCPTWTHMARSAAVLLEGSYIETRDKFAAAKPAVKRATLS